MQHISPVKIIAAIVAAVLAVAVMFYASEARQGTADLLSVVRVKSPAASGQAVPPAEVGARASGVRVMPVGVVSRPASANEGKAGGG